LDFIADSDEEPEVDDLDDLLERLDEGAEQTTDQLRKEKEASPSKTQKSPPKARKSSPKASFKAKMPSPMAVSQPKKTKRVARKKRKVRIYSFLLFLCLNILHQRSTPDSFIEDDSSVGEASYADSEEADAPG